MKFKLFSLLLILLCISFISSNAFMADKCELSDVKTVPFCKIVKEPNKYEDKRIKTTAVYQTTFMGNTLLTNSDCDNNSILFELDSTDEKRLLEIKKKIENNLEWEQNQITKSVKISFVGILRKNKQRAVTPIKGVLQDYTMVIESVDILDSQQ